LRTCLISDHIKPLDNCGFLIFTVFVTRFILYFNILEDKQIEDMLISDHIKPLDICGFLMLSVFATRFILYFDILEDKQNENMLQ
jgi:hypothetical protein